MNSSHLNHPLVFLRIACLLFNLSQLFVSVPTPSYLVWLYTPPAGPSPTLFSLSFVPPFFALLCNTLPSTFFFSPDHLD